MISKKEIYTWITGTLFSSVTGISFPPGLSSTASTYIDGYGKLNRSKVVMEWLLRACIPSQTYPRQHKTLYPDQHPQYCCQESRANFWKVESVCLLFSFLFPLFLDSLMVLMVHGLQVLECNRNAQNMFIKTPGKTNFQYLPMINSHT